MELKRNNSMKKISSATKIFILDQIEDETITSKTINIEYEELIETTPQINTKMEPRSNKWDKIYGVSFYYYLHFYIITTFEIFFYFYYIAPYETKVFNELIISIIDQIPRNNTRNLFTEPAQCTQYYKLLDDFNTILYEKTMGWVIGSSIILFIFFVIDMYRTYSPKSTLVQTGINQIINSHFFRELGKSAIFIFIIGIFEYLFFTLVINNYKITNANCLVCKIIEYFSD